MCHTENTFLLAKTVDDLFETKRCTENKLNTLFSRAEKVTVWESELTKYVNINPMKSESTGHEELSKKII